MVFGIYEGEVGHIEFGNLFSLRIMMEQYQWNEQKDKQI